MYAMQFSLYGSKAYPLLASAFYERVAELYELPALSTLLKSLKEEVAWPDASEVYYLDNLREQNRRHLFQVRFSPSSPHARQPVSLFLSVEESQVHIITVQFPPRGDRGASSKLLETLKLIAKELHVPAGDLSFVVEGFMEMGSIRFIRETRLSGFVWIEGLGRYLHVTEDPRRVKEVQKGTQRL